MMLIAHQQICFLLTGKLLLLLLLF